jgi:hypothetical protein
VEVVLGTRLSADDIRRAQADTIIIATGSRPRMDGLQPARPFEPAAGVDLPHVRTAARVLNGEVPDGAASALVLDAVGGFEAVTAAEHLVAGGLAVTFVTSLPSFAPAVAATCRDVPALEFLYDGDFTLLTRHHLVEVRPGTCVVRPQQGRRTQEVPADVVVLVTPNEPERDLHDELAGTRPAGELVLIGDAASPRDLQVAIAEGHRTARAITARS